MGWASGGKAREISSIRHGGRSSRTAISRVTAIAPSAPAVSTQSRAANDVSWFPSNRGDFGCGDHDKCETAGQAACAATEPFSSPDLSRLKYVDRLGELSGLPA